MAQSKEYIESHKLLATILSETYSIPTSIILAVAIVESSAGDGFVAKKLNNHFGIVGKNAVKYKNGHKTKYKQYANEIESYIDFCELVANKSFYSKLKNKKEVKLWVKAISKTGYSELPLVWEKRILTTIHTNHL